MLCAWRPKTVNNVNSFDYELQVVTIMVNPVHNCMDPKSSQQPSDTHSI
jgi:hypothetical protein